MKIAIPTDNKKGLEDTVAAHFGRCKTYTFLDENGKTLEIVDNESEHSGGTGLPPEFLKKHDINILLCKDLGIRALRLCKELGIDVYVSNVETVKEIFDLWKDKKLTIANTDDVCGVE